MTSDQTKKATGHDIILTIGHAMREGLEPLLTETLAPSLYQIYLHADDFERLQGVFPKIKAEASRHLDAELAQLNEAPKSRLGRLRDMLQRKGAPESPAMRFASTEDGWYFEFEKDPNGDLQPGDVEVVTDLAVGDATRYGSGRQTHRVLSTTRRLGKMETRQSTRERDLDITRMPPPAPTPPAVDAPVSNPSASTATAATSKAPVLARFQYEDDSGAHQYDMRRDEIVIGRKADDAWVDLHLDTALDVSREHARVKRDDGRFFIKDLSTFGTKVDGHPIEPSMVVEDGQEKDLQHWTELPDGARIELASVVTLSFEVVAG